MTFTRIARINTYISLAAPLIASKSLFFPFITGKILFFRIFTELALLAVAGAVLYGEIPLARLKNTVKKPIFIAISIFTALFTLSAFTAHVPSFAFWSNFERGEGVWQMLHYFLFFFLITVLFQSKNEWKRLISVHVILAVFVGLYGVGQALNWPKWIIDPNTGVSVSGTLGSPAYLGIYMAFATFFAIWLSFQSQGNVKLFWLCIAFFEFISFLMAQNRGSFAAVSIGVTIILITWLLQKKRSKKNTIYAGLIVFLILCGMGTLIFTVKGGEAIKGFQPRLWTWQSALSGVIERPITGSGAENFPFVFDAYYNPKHYLLESWFDRAHNTALEYLIIGGIPLFIAYAGIFAVLYRRLLRKKNEAMFPFFTALPLIYLINGLAIFETLPIYIVFFLLNAFITAFTDGFSNHEAAHGPRNTARSAYATFFVLCILVPLSLYATVYLPLRKNLLILDAMRTNGKTDVEIFKKHEDTLNYRSPVGAQEELQGLLTFTVSYFDYLRANGLTKQVSKEKIAEIMKMNAHWYDRFGPYAPGLKIMYIRITGLLAAYQETKDVAYLKEADRLIALGTAASPTRIEFVRFALASAALRGDKAAYTAANNKGKALLPNYDWEPDMAKFVY